MNKSQPVLIENLVVRDRLPRPDPDVRTLAVSVKKTGLKVPILIDSGNNILDGLQRVLALKALGREEVHAIVCETFEDVCENLAKSVQVNGSPPYWRVFELFNATNVLQQDRGKRMRKLTRETKQTHQRSRELLAYSLGFEHEGVIGTVTSVYKACYGLDGVERVTRQLKQIEEIRLSLEKGDVTLYEAKGMITRVDNPIGALVGNITKPQEQIEAITTSLSQLAGFTKGVSRLGPLSPDLEKFQLELLLRGFEDERRHLARFIKKIKERIDQL